MRPGERVRTRVPIGELVDGTVVTLPVATICGVEPGPTVYVQAGVHGDEETAIETCRQVIDAVDPRSIAGRLVCVPVANPPAHLTRSRGYAFEERRVVDVNRVFPGNAEGLWSERIAHVLYEQFARHADLTIDLHSPVYGYQTLPLLVLDPADAESATYALRRRIAVMSGVQLVYHIAGRGDDPRKAGWLGTHLETTGRAHVTIELGESRAVDTASVLIGVRAVRNALRVLELEHHPAENVHEPRHFTRLASVKATRGGGLRFHAALGQEVARGSVIADVIDPFGRPIEQLCAPTPGLVARAIRFGSVSSGADVALLATEFIDT